MSDAGLRRLLEAFVEVHGGAGIPSGEVGRCADFSTAKNVGEVTRRVSYLYGYVEALIFWDLILWEEGSALLDEIMAEALEKCREWVKV